MSHQDSESALVKDYLECFGQVARIVSNAASVPDELWTRMRESWAAMSAEERDEVERRVRDGKTAGKET